MRVIGEHKTNGQDVIVLRGNGSAFHWVDAASCGVEVSGEWAATATAGPGWRTMSEAEAWAWLCMVPKRIDGIPDDDWQGMYHVAAKRAQEWEDKAKALQAELDAAREAVKWWFVPEHDAICRSMPSKSCCCNADAAAVRRRDARIALKLEVGK